MGAGIAQLGCLAGMRTRLHDPDHAALNRAIDAVGARIEREAQRGRLDAREARAALERLVAAPTLAELADCELVIEAAPERAELKRDLFRALSEIVASDCVLATNTSSLSVTALASAAARPERVVGMHFFNPPPLMAAVEIVAGLHSGESALDAARAAGEAMGRRVIDAADGPGFLINRCNRPFSLEALRLLSERVATAEQIDRICRLGGRFRMGPFELMDLVGLDVGLDVARSFHEQSFGEPRWRPSPLVASMVAAGRLGRKAGRGWYEYPPSGSHRPPDPEPPPAGGAEGLVVIEGTSTLARQIADAARGAGWEVAGVEPEAGGGRPFLVLEVDREHNRAGRPAVGRGTSPGEDETARHGGMCAQPAATPAATAEDQRRGAPRAVCCWSGSLAALEGAGPAVGFHALAPFAECGLVEMTRGPGTDPSAQRAAERFFTSLGRHVEWVADAPGLVLGRIVCALVNEAAFALGEGVGEALDIDAGMRLGLNYPRGVLAWGDEIGLDRVLGALEGLCRERGEDRYRPAPALRSLCLTGRLGRATGEGFLAHGAQ